MRSLMHRLMAEARDGELREQLTYYVGGIALVMCWLLLRLLLG
jgi:hypothetical protein